MSHKKDIWFKWVSNKCFLKESKKSARLDCSSRISLIWNDFFPPAFPAFPGKRSDGPDLGPNCLQRLTTVTDNESCQFINNRSFVKETKQIVPDQITPPRAG